MAYDKTNLARIAGGNGFSLWHYTTTDAAAVVDSAAYFTGEAVGMLLVGDFILANVDTDGTPAHGILVVTANDGATVDVDDITAVGGTDTD